MRARLRAAIIGMAFAAVYAQGTPAAPSVAMGAVHACAVKESGVAVCWGWNIAGQLGDGTVSTDPRNQAVTSPVNVALLGANVAQITAGAEHTCALTRAGAAYCWGFNFFGQLGRGFNENGRVDSPLPVQVDTFSSGVAQISAGGLHTCAVTTAGAAYCWGWAAYGQVGAGFFGSPDNSSLPTFPFPVQGLSSGVASISAGGRHTCAVTTAGAALCWGANEAGQLGDGTTTDQPGPVQVTGLTSGVVSISAGSQHSCALMQGGSVKCWGDNRHGELGIGRGGLDGSNGSLVPLDVVGLPAPAAAIATGGSQSNTGGRTCVLTTAGAALCWGSNFLGGLGNGSETGLSDYIAAPTPVSFLSSGVAGIAAGLDSGCALMISGSVLCWGWNDYGTLGDGTFLTRLRPVPVLRESGAGSIAANDWFLNLRGAGATVPSQRIPPFLVLATGLVNASSPGLKSGKVDAPVSVTIDAQFRASDAGRPIYVFAYAPSGIAKRGKDGPDACVLSQLSPAGQLQQASASGMQQYAANVTGAQHQSVTVLNNVPGSQVAGATFCVGVASTGSQAVSTANSRCVATIPSAGTICRPPEEQAGDVTANVPGALSGLWWNAGESGWGIHFTQRSANVFAAWYTYNASGNPKWYVSTCNMAGGATGSTGTCNGTIYEVSGPTFFGTAFNPNLANAVAAGNLQVNFQNAGAASMTYSGVAGQTRTVAITRQPLATGTTPPAIDYTDIWWGGASESGWGLAITQQYSTLFLAWYVYDDTGKPMWYVATCTLSGTTCASSLLRTTGPAFGPAFNPNQVQVFTAGSVSVNFTDANNATLSYTVNGASATKTITRQLF